MCKYTLKWDNWVDALVLRLILIDLSDSCLHCFLSNNLQLWIGLYAIIIVALVLSQVASVPNAVFTKHTLAYLVTYHRYNHLRSCHCPIYRPPQYSSVPDMPCPYGMPPRLCERSGRYYRVIYNNSVINCARLSNNHTTHTLLRLTFA